MRVTATLIGLFATTTGCGDDDCCAVQRDAAVGLDAPGDAFVDAAPVNSGFTPPAAVVSAFTESSPGTFTPTTLDLSCLGTQRVDTATSVQVSLTVTVRDFQSDNLVPSASVSAFEDLAYTAPFATATGDGSTAQATITIPSGTQRHGVFIQHANGRPTYTLDLLANPTAANQARTVLSMSNATVATLPALVGQTQMAGRALIVGRLFDCAQHQMSNFIATISSMPGLPIHLQDATTYYFDSSVGLPVSHASSPRADPDGRFMIIHVPAATTAYLQMWGYPNSTDLSTQALRLLAELPITVVANGAFVTDHDPRRVQ